MKRSNIILLIILCLAVAGGVFMVFHMEKSTAPAKQEAPAVTASPVPTATPTPEPTAVPTAEPTATPAPTGTPVSTPVITPPPVATPTPEPAYSSEGSFRSDTGAWLNIIVKWSIDEDEEGKTITLDAYAESYSLVANGGTDLEFIVNSEVAHEASKAVNVDSDHGFVETKLGSATLPVESGKTAHVFVTWVFNGTYGSKNGRVEIGSITADADIYIP